ncbi:Nse1 non-SMC component of SMC5-6 complex-domain-containing protein [Thamnidium elegans]|nr:Nse1 non-SMC component of SMC5-6 complex-domain-containing protein [Thamnidium elegans]
MTSQYNDSHRLFVQGMLTKRIITEPEAKQLYDQVLEATSLPNNVEYEMFISEINKELVELDYALRICHDEREGEPYLTFVNAKQDPMTEDATTFKPAEISYCRELFDAIINADNEDFAISATQALNLGSKITPVKLTQRESQELLNKLVQDKWIAFERKGVYYIDTRALAELQHYFREEYGEAVKECTICLDIITMGESCSVRQCPVRIHKYCADKQFRNTPQPLCPQCGSRWSRDKVFGLGLPDNSYTDDEDMSD